MKFNASYSDLTIPAETPATVTLGSDRMIIEIASANQQREWFYGLIRKKSERDRELRLTYKDPLKGKLRIADPQFLFEAKRIAGYAQFTNPTPWYQSRNGLYSMFAVKIGTIIIAILLFFFAVPVLINFVVDRISVQTEASIGKKIQNTIVNPLEVDSQQTRLVNEFFSQLSKPGDDPVHITVMNSEVKNAFTFPGGEILIDNGIFTVMQNYSELAAVLGHESGHAVNRDPLKMLCRQSATSVLVLSLVGNMNGVINEVLSNASYLENLSYSREYESKADEFGYEWMKKNDINPQGMIDLLNHLEADGGSGVNVEFISNHPTTENRIKDLKEMMKKDEIRQYSTNAKLDSIWNQIKAAEPSVNSKQ